MINTKQYREIEGINDIGKEVYFYDYTKKEFYIIGILKGFDCALYEIQTEQGIIQNFQTGYIKL